MPRQSGRGNGVVVGLPQETTSERAPLQPLVVALSREEGRVEAALPLPERPLQPLDEPDFHRGPQRPLAREKERDRGGADPARARKLALRDVAEELHGEPQAVGTHHAAPPPHARSPTETAARLRDQQRCLTAAPFAAVQPACPPAPWPPRTARPTALPAAYGRIPPPPRGPPDRTRARQPGRPPVAVRGEPCGGGRGPASAAFAGGPETIGKGVSVPRGGSWRGGRRGHPWLMYCCVSGACARNSTQSLGRGGQASEAIA